MADDSQFDVSTLTGLDSGGGSPLTGAVTPPMAPPPDPNAPATTNAPISGDLQPPAPTSPVSVQSPAPPPAAGQPSVWKNIVMGAIYGLAGSAGSTHFGGGLAAGAAGAIEGKQREIANQQRSQQLQMESVRAADTHIAALDEHNRAQRLDSDAKLEYAQKSANYQAFLQDNFGIEPNLSFNDAASEATGAHNTLAGQNGGTIPPVATVQQPAPDGTHGKIAVFSPSQQQMQQNANGFRDLINTQRAVQGQPPIDNATFNSLGFKGQRDAAQQAITFLKPTPSFSMDKNKPDYLPAVLAQRQQQLAQYQAHKDANGNPDANPNVEKQLQDSISYLQSSWDSVNKQENKAASDAIDATAGARANSAAQVAGAEEKAKLNADQNAGTGGPGAGKTGNDYLAALPPETANMVKAIGEGRVELTPAMLRSKEGQVLAKHLTQAYPDFDQSRAQSYFATRKDFTSGKTSTGINSYNTAIAHLGTMYDHVAGTNSLQLNNPLSDVHRQLDLDKQLVSTELAKAVSNGQMTEGEKKEILSGISGATVGSYQTRIKEATDLLEGKLEAYQNQWNNGAPPGAVHQVQIVSNKAQQTLNHIRGVNAPAAARPGGATMKVPGSDGKLHWSDGKTDLGVAE